jgi:murein L,D-transpeptidase YcbB/YkuD
MQSGFRAGLPLDRRLFLRRAAAGTGALAGSLALPRLAAADEQSVLQALINQNQNGEYGQGFDSSLRNVTMPKASLPTLSAATAQSTEQAIAKYEGIVTMGGWPHVPESNRLRVGYRHPSVQALRQRLRVGGDLEIEAGAGDVFDTYVEAAVRRFQARHGVHVTGIVAEATLHAMNIPADVRLNQLRTNLVRLRNFATIHANRMVVSSSWRW